MTAWKETTYTTDRGEHEAIYLPWGAMHEAGIDPDDEGSIMASVPDGWAGVKRGWIDENGWGLYR